MKPANLTSTLLTRKGRAQPTLISPPRSAEPPPPAPPSPVPPLWRIKEPPVAAAPIAWPDHMQAERLANALRHDAEKRVHMSLRLDPGRHLRLRIESSRTGRSMQSLLLQALDEFLARDGPGLSGEAAPHNGAHGKIDAGNRREPGQPIGAESNGGSSQT